MCLVNRQVNAACSFTDSSSISLPLSLSLGCSAAAPDRAGGRCAAAEAGATEVQHGQRSARSRECEMKLRFPFCTLKYLSCSTHDFISVCRQSSNRSWVKGTNYWVNMRYCLLIFRLVCNIHVSENLSSTFLVTKAATWEKGQDSAATATKAERSAA